MRVHLQVDGAPANVRASAREIAYAGADGMFSFEGQHDVFFPLVLAAEETDLQLMTNVAIAGPRSPLHLAHAAYDLQSYSRGRFRLGLGSQIRPHIEKRYGAQWGRPAARMAESVGAVKAILAAWEGLAPLDFRGDFFTHTLMPPNFNPGPNPYGAPPVLMGALGPVMTRKAAEVADGLLVMPIWPRPLTAWPSSSPSTGRRRPTARFLRWRAGLSCRQNSTCCPSEATSRRCAASSPTTWSARTPSSDRLRSVLTRSTSATATTRQTCVVTFPASRRTPRTPPISWRHSRRTLLGGMGPMASGPCKGIEPWPNH